MAEMADRIRWAREESLRLLALKGEDNQAAHEVAAARQMLSSSPGGAAFAASITEFLEQTYSSDWENLQVVGTNLARWADYAEAGMAEPSRAPVAARTEAATDLLEQVQQLLDTDGVEAAAPVVLAGAALEELLRGLVIAHDLETTGTPSIGAYANALRTADVISRQQRKAIEMCAGLRNHAAHGEFDSVTPASAQLMAQQVNLLLSELGAV